MTVYWGESFVGDDVTGVVVVSVILFPVSLSHLSDTAVTSLSVLCQYGYCALMRHIREEEKKHSCSIDVTVFFLIIYIDDTDAVYLVLSTR